MADSGLENERRAKDAFLASISHELRTPLTPSIAIISALVKDPSLSSTAREMLLLVESGLRIQTNLINDIIDVVQLAQGDLLYTYDVVDVHDSLHTAIRTLNDESKMIGVEFLHSCTASNCLMNADKTRITQVFTNLLRNAVKSMPRGGTIRISTENSIRDSDHTIVLSFVDFGFGVLPEFHEKIFELFHKGDGPRATGGLGLGLTISKAIVEAHRGTIRCISAGVDQGTTFKVELPVIKEWTGVDQKMAKETNRIRVFFIEDNANTILAYTKLLSLSGFEVVHVASCKEATSVIESHDAPPFDIILSDIGLPDGTGWDVMRNIQTKWGHVPGIALSGYGSAEDVERSHKSGFHEHIQKPVDFPYLVERLVSLAKQ